ncbi:Crp/Fnr family transcriptional regulator [Glycomyces terrestris]|uniref:Crp/Fnr family transcriptional regulator n=1 Tax=Glycomyces terrestris TaxID=2493553 RepID=A0A426UZZ2_9ACTN|nr:Crp/Fnr family transcriptional regulator [Glycomyces terrestris]RRS00162.1 Crp/Fnr family transcriptional regulator [Glycomyces terrestris]
MPHTPRHLHTRGFRELLTMEQWQALVAAGHRTTIPAGTRFLDQGGRKPAVYVLEQGRVRVVYTEPDGNEVLIAIRGPGDLIGEYAQRDQGDHMASVWTLEGCVAVVLTGDAFEHFLHRTRLEAALQRYMLAKARQGAERIWRAANLHTEQRLAQLFLEIINAGSNHPQPVVPMSQVLIASSLGVTRRSVNQLLSQWREHGLVRTRPSPITVLDLPALTRRANLR